MRLDIIEHICDSIIENKENLTELDRAVGDGDHGVNLSRGMEKIKENLPSFQGLKPFEILNKCAMLLMSNVGGASGALYASALMNGAKYLKTKENITNEDICETWKMMIEGIKHRGKTSENEKTMIDTLVPAYLAFKDKVEHNEDLKIAFESAESAGKDGMEATKTILATKGRASYLGERSIGHIDPGSFSSYLIIKTIAHTI